MITLKSIKQKAESLKNETIEFIINSVGDNSFERINTRYPFVVNYASPNNPRYLHSISKDTVMLIDSFNTKYRYSFYGALTINELLSIAYNLDEVINVCGKEIV
ncbi:MAG: hypothetical protein ACRDD8_09615 [Bacteroidales bacterium]